MLLSDYPQSEAMYPESVETPLNDPVNSTNPATFDIDCGWYPYIVGALKSLRQQGTWRTATDDQLIAVLNQVDTLLEHMTDVILAACSEIPTAFECSFNFFDTSGSWSSETGATWNSGVGWEGHPTSADPCVEPFCIAFHFGTAITISSLRVVGHRGSSAGIANHAAFVTVGGVQSIYGSLPSERGDYDFTLVSTVDNVTDVEICMGSDADEICGVDSTITSVVVTGVSGENVCPEP